MASLPSTKLMDSIPPMSYERYVFLGIESTGLDRSASTVLLDQREINIGGFEEINHVV